RKWDRISKNRRTLTFLEEAQRNVEKIKVEEERLKNNINLSRVKYNLTIALRDNLDLKIIDKYKHNLERKFEEIKINTKSRRELFQRAVFKRRNEEDLRKIQLLSFENLMIEMDIPVNNNLFASKEFTNFY
ncbi:hypothetical protein LCGC14_1325890, partial [marine sediment metagenome]